MIYCPRCNSKTVVLDSRKTLEHIRRRRECEQCKHRFTTKEVVVLEKRTRMTNADIPLPNSPDPAWDYYALWEDLSQIKDDANALINFISDYEHTSAAADSEIKAKIDILVSNLEAAKELI